MLRRFIWLGLSSLSRGGSVFHSAVSEPSGRLLKFLSLFSGLLELATLEAKYCGAVG